MRSLLHLLPKKITGWDRFIFGTIKRIALHLHIHLHTHTNIIIVSSSFAWHKEEMDSASILSPSPRTYSYLTFGYLAWPSIYSKPKLFCASNRFDDCWGFVLCKRIFKMFYDALNGGVGQPR